MSRDERGLWLALVDAVVHLPAARCQHQLGGLTRSRGVWSSDCLLLMKVTTSWGQWWYWCCWCRREVNHEAGCCGCGSWTMELGEVSCTGLLMSAAKQRNLFASGTYCCCLENHISYTIYLTCIKWQISRRLISLFHHLGTYTTHLLVLLLMIYFVWWVCMTPKWYSCWRCWLLWFRVILLTSTMCYA